jgi:hypothetical protein
LGQRPSEATLEKLRAARKKHPGSPSKGKKWSLAARLLKSQAMMGMRTGAKHPLFGTHMSEETREKIRLGHKNSKVKQGRPKKVSNSSIMP